MKRANAKPRALTRSRPELIKESLDRRCIDREAQTREPSRSIDQRISYPIGCVDDIIDESAATNRITYRAPIAQLRCANEANVS